MNQIYYLSYYDTPDSESNIVLSAVNKIDYILQVLQKMQYSVDIISACMASTAMLRKGQFRAIKEGITLKTFTSLPNGNIVKRVLRRFYLRKQIKKYFNKNLHKNDVIIIYHSLGYYWLYKYIKHKIGCKIILEAEEIYTDVGKCRGISLSQELTAFSFADAYIFPTELLNRKINVKNKPYTIIHGTYNVEPVLTTQFNDGKIHCVYAGTFDPRKGGAAAAAAAGLFLNSNYHIHIIGFGSENDKKMLINAIEEVSKKTECKVTYDGCLSGEAYLKFIQKCHIGLSTQNPNAAFNDTSFPSKILSYMANGLRVVSVRIPAIEGSAIGEYMYYYDEQTPENIAQAIMQVDINEDYDSRKIIAELDKQFQEDLQIIL